MSREIDPHNMGPEDVEYVRQRPSLRQEFVMQGLGDPLSKDYPGRNEDLFEDTDSDTQDAGATGPSPQEADRLRQQEADAQEAERRSAEEARLAREAAEEAEQKARELEDLPNGGRSEDGGSGATEEAFELTPEQRWTKDMNKAELLSVIEARNEDYEGDDKIDVGSKPTKTELINLLETDDEELAAAADE